MYVCIVITYRKSKDQPGKVILTLLVASCMNRENEYFPVPTLRARELFGLSRDAFDSPVITSK